MHPYYENSQFKKNSINYQLMLKIFNGNLLAKQLMEQMKVKGRPSLSIIMVGDSVASKSFINRKLKACEFVGIDAKLYQFDQLEQDKLIRHIQSLDTDGILVQLPLPSYLNRSIIEAIPVEKDVDCLHSANLEKLIVQGELNPLLPCTAAAVLQILDYYNINLAGQKVTVIGRSVLVGLPLSLLLMKRNATVTVCHKQTSNIQEHILNADIGAIVIDVGINRAENNKIVGDVNFDLVSKKASIITPVPGEIQLTSGN
ncbi:hypothetical protein pb186bvf_013797 [Paramecium bursaria]